MSAELASSMPIRRIVELERPQLLSPEVKTQPKRRRTSAILPLHGGRPSQQITANASGDCFEGH